MFIYSKPQLIFTITVPKLLGGFINMLIEMNSSLIFQDCKQMERTTVMIFWGSLFAQYLWLQRQALYNNTKDLVRNAAITIWDRSIKKLKSFTAKKTVSFKQRESEEQINSESASNILNEDKEAKHEINKQKKIKKEKPKQSKNMRRALKKYEDWFLQNRNIRKMAKRIQNPDGEKQEPSFLLKRQSFDFNDNMANYNVEQLYEDYCDEIDEQYSNGNILGYNPLVSDDEHESDNNLNHFTSRSRQ